LVRTDTRNGYNEYAISLGTTADIISLSGSFGINAYDETNLRFGRFGYTGQAWLPEVALYY
jgi:hypothetical protein